MIRASSILILYSTGLLLCMACNNEAVRKKDDHKSHQHTAAGPDGYADSVNAGLIASDTLKGSPRRLAMDNIGGAHIHIEYGSPGVKDRIIWGGLVPYDKVWAAGAHSATSINFSSEVLVGDKPVPPGKYAFFIIPGRERWIAILNKNYQQHLADDYTPDEDVLRMEIVPAKLEKPVPRLTYFVKAKDKNTGEIIMQWEKAEIRIPVSAK